MRKEDRLTGLDKKYLWHPFTQMKEWEESHPLIIESSRGNYLFDWRGRRYLDATSSIWVNLHGHQKGAIDTAIRRQLKKVAHSTLLGLSSTPAILLANELVKIAPQGLTRVFYSDNGSTAVEVALKMAFQYWRHLGEPGRTKFISFANAYHGDTVGAVSVGGIDLFHGAYRPLLFESIKAPSAYCYRCPLGLSFPRCGIACAEEIEKILKRSPGQIAAVVVEPVVQAAAGMIMAPAGYLVRLRSLCDQYGVLLIVDEVATGFGRTGRMFACEHQGVAPDLMAIAKGLSGGYLPLAATLTTESIYRAFLGSYRDFKTFFHGHSYTGNPLCCAAALANLKIFRRERVLQKVRAKTRVMERSLRDIEKLPHTGEVRQRGLMVGIELVENKETRKPYPLEGRMGHRVCERMRDAGILLRPLGNVIVLMPPLSVTLGEIRRMVRELSKAIRDITEAGGPQRPRADRERTRRSAPGYLRVRRK